MIDYNNLGINTTSQSGLNYIIDKNGLLKLNYDSFFNKNINTDDDNIVKDSKIVFYIISDMHFKDGVQNNPNATDAYYDFGNRVRAWYQIDEKFSNFINTCNIGKPDYVIIPGDIFEYKYTLEQANNLNYKKYIDTLNVPLLCTYGNHDNYNTMKEYATTQNSIENAKSVFNFAKYIEKGNTKLKLIFIDNYIKEDSTIENSAVGLLSESTKQFIVNEINNSTTKNIVFISHNAIKKDYVYFNNDNATWFHALLQNINSNNNYNFLCLYGHEHEYDYLLEDYTYCKMLRIPTFLDIFKNNETSLRNSNFLSLEFELNNLTIQQKTVTYTGELQQF